MPDRRARRLALRAALGLGGLAALGGGASGCAGEPARAVVPGPGFVLHSPFGEEATDSWHARLARETVAVAGFLAAPLTGPSIDVYLEPVDADEKAGVLSELYPQKDGVAGWADDATIHLVVSASFGGHASATRVERLRHELAHVFLRRLSWHAPAWLREGLAHETEDAVSTGHGLALHPAPVSLLAARVYAGEVGMARLWRWDGRGTSARESRLRVLARSFVRYLIEHEAPAAWQNGLKRAARLTPAELVSLTGGWEAWLAGFDAVARIERGTRDPDAAIRRAAAAALPELAELEQILGRPLAGKVDAGRARRDELALSLVRDADCGAAASRYLVYFRAHALSEATLESLAASAGVPARLTAATLRARRGEPYDALAARALWEGLAVAQRARYAWVPSVLRAGARAR